MIFLSLDIYCQFYLKGILFGVTAAAICIILVITLLFILKKKPNILNSIVGKGNLEARELEPFDSKHKPGQDENKYDQREEYNYDQGEEYNYDQGGSYYY